MFSEPQAEHRWLERLVGEWTMESECVMAPGAEPMKSSGKESVRSISGLWMLCEGAGETPGGAMTSIMTLGYDPAKQHFVGTFIASCMTHLWQYRGEWDEAANRLSLLAEGPSFAGDGTTANYRDEIAFQNDNERTLTSYLQTPDGAWTCFMTARYRRVL